MVVNRPHLFGDDNQNLTSQELNSGAQEQAEFQMAAEEAAHLIDIETEEIKAIKRPTTTTYQNLRYCRLFGFELLARQH